MTFCPFISHHQRNFLLSCSRWEQKQRPTARQFAKNEGPSFGTVSSMPDATVKSLLRAQRTLWKRSQQECKSWRELRTTGDQKAFKTQQSWHTGTHRNCGCMLGACMGLYQIRALELKGEVDMLPSLIQKPSLTGSHLHTKALLFS